MATKPGWKSAEHRLNTDDDPRDDDDDGGGGNALPFILVIVAIVVGTFAITSGIAAFQSTMSTAPGVATCTTSGWGFVKLECPGNRMMGPTFGYWFCGNPATNHPCGTNPP